MELIQPSWFCVRSHQKHEHIAAARLRELPDVKAFNPQLRFVRLTRRGRVWSTESLFPNYLFARFDLATMLERVRYTPSVRSVLRFGDRVPSVPDPVIRELQHRMEVECSRVFTDAPVEGEEVEVNVGPFQGAKGAVTRILPAKQRVEILLDVMGRCVPTELSLDLLLFKRRDPATWFLRPAPASGPQPIVVAEAAQHLPFAAVASHNPVQPIEARPAA